MNQNWNESYIFLKWKTHSFVFNLVPKTLELLFRALKFQNILGKNTLQTLSSSCRKMGLLAPCWYSQILFSNRWLLQFYWNPYSFHRHAHKIVESRTCWEVVENPIQQLFLAFFVKNNCENWLATYLNTLKAVAL